jgi:hypothetical protein
METSVGRVLLSVLSAGFTALSLAYIAHYDFGLSRQEIRTPAMVSAAVIAVFGGYRVLRQEIAQTQAIEAR